MAGTVVPRQPPERAQHRPVSAEHDDDVGLGRLCFGESDLVLLQLVSRHDELDAGLLRNGFEPRECLVGGLAATMRDDRCALDGISHRPPPRSSDRARPAAPGARSGRGRGRTRGFPSARQPRVDDRPRFGCPAERGLGDLAQHTPVHLGVAHDAAARNVSFPASNCGLTRTSACQPGCASTSTGGSTVRTLMNETSQTTRSGAKGSSRGSARSCARARSRAPSERSRRSSWP